MHPRQPAGPIGEGCATNVGRVSAPRPDCLLGGAAHLRHPPRAPSEARDLGHMVAALEGAVPEPDQPATDWRPTRGAGEVRSTSGSGAPPGISAGGSTTFVSGPACCARRVCCPVLSRAFPRRPKVFASQHIQMARGIYLLSIFRVQRAGGLAARPLTSTKMVGRGKKILRKCGLHWAVQRGKMIWGLYVRRDH
jgi:hypothetical protein